MKFNITDEIPFPREIAFETHRDKLVELVPYFSNVDSIVVKERVEEGDKITLVNEWTGSSDDVPSVMRSLVKPEHLSWIDRAVWDRSKWQADWQITLNALPDAVTAKGTTAFFDEGDETLVRISGEFVIHPDKIPAVPGFVARAAAGPVERFVVSLLQPNMKRSNEAVTQYLEDNA